MNTNLNISKSTAVSALHMAPLGGGYVGCSDFNVISCIITNRARDFGIDDPIKLCILLISMSKLAILTLNCILILQPTHGNDIINFNLGLRRAMWGFNQP